MTGARPGSWRDHAAPVLALLAAWLCWALYFWRCGVPAPDEGYVFQHARELLAGKRLYQDVVPHIPPLSILVQAAWISLCGPLLAVARVHFVLVQALTAALVYVNVARIVPRWWAAAVTVPTLTACQALVPVFAWYNTDAMLLFLIGTTLLLSAGRTTARALWAGVMFGLSALAKTNIGAIGAVAATVVALRGGPRRALAVAAGAALPPLAFALWLFAASDPGAFFAFSVSGQIHDKGGLSMPANLVRPLLARDASAAYMVLTGAALLVLARRRALAVLGLVMLGAGMAAADRWLGVLQVLYPAQCAGLAATALLLFLSRGQDREPPAAVVELGLMSAGLLATDSLSQPLPPLQNSCAHLSLPFVLAAPLVLSARGVGRLRPRALVTLLVAITAAGMLGRILFPYRELPLPMQTHALTAPGLAGLLASPEWGRELDAFAARASREIGDDRTALLVYPEAPALYVATGTHCPTRILNLAVTFSRPIADAFQDQDLARLHARPPLAVLFAKSFHPRRPAGPYTPDMLRACNRFTRISAWLAGRYRPVEDGRWLTLLVPVSAPPR